MVADPLISQGPTVVRRLASLYSPVIQRSRAAWGAVYHSSNTKPTFAAIRAVFGPGVRKVIVELIKKHDPDVVLSVHPLLNQISHQAIQRCGRPRGLMTVITDLVDFHRGWTFSQADLVIAPTEVARKVAIRRRVPHERVKLLGLPVDMRFRPPAAGEKQALRRRFGLDEARFTVLVMGGAAGVGGLLNQVRVLGWEPHQWQVIAVCGRNEKLRRRLARLRFATPTLVLGFVDNMPEVMRACDVVVTKAGSSSSRASASTRLASTTSSTRCGCSPRAVPRGSRCPTARAICRIRTRRQTSPASACCWRAATAHRRTQAGRGRGGTSAAPAAVRSRLPGSHRRPQRRSAWLQLAATGLHRA